MKNESRILLLLISSALFLTSCHDMLTEDSRSQITDNYLNSATGLQDGLSACYSYSRQIYGSSETSLRAIIPGTDTVTSGFGGNFDLARYTANLNSSHGDFNFLWNNLYEGINACNAVINRAPEIDNIAANLRDIRVAEAKFLRALYYFHLVRQFGAVHLTLDETSGVELEATRAPIGDIYQAIIADLNAGVQNLPIVASDYGRATKPAAEHLLSLVYLTRAGSGAAQGSDYNNAAELARRVIHDYSFKLLDNFEDVFEFGGDKNDEVIWSVQYSQNLITQGSGNTIHAYFLLRYELIPGMVRDISVGRPFSRFRPTQLTFEELFDRQHDDRYDKSFYRVLYATRSGTFTSVNGHQITLALGDTAAYFTDVEWTEEQISNAGYNVYTPSLQNDRLYPILTKFQDYERPDVNDMRGSRDVLVMRLAETYLIAAEALMMSGNLNDAATYVNAVRRRAAKKGATETETESNRAAMEITPNQLNIDFILDERGRELLGEIMRWYDLVRTGKLVERVRLYNVEARNNIKDHHVLRPIPQNQIDRTRSEFPQNPGY